MTAEDSERLRALLSRRVDHEPLSLETMCRACVTLLPVSGAAISLMAPAQTQSMASAFDGRARVLHDLEFTLGEGPAMDAVALGRPVLVDDVRSLGQRWPQFSNAVASMGVRAVYALPLQAMAVTLGVLVLYRI